MDAFYIIYSHLIYIEDEIKVSIFNIFRSGGSIEVMGLLLGKVDANVMVVMDAFALPVEGTETRVNVQSEGFEYMTAYVEAAKRVGRLEHVLGWYHSHPGYGCWLSGWSNCYLF